MAVFVDLGDEDNVPSQNGSSLWNGQVDPTKSVQMAGPGGTAPGGGGTNAHTDTADNQPEQAHGLAVRENLNRNSMTQALGCYPIIMSVAASIDLNTLDNLSRTCRQIRQGLLQYRKMLLVSTLHCVNEDLPVDPEETLRYRARAGNWYYMQDAGRATYYGKAGQCARDLVAECRRCGTVVCRNCAIKPPAPIVLRDRHRRLCDACVHAPLGSLVKPPLGPEIRVDSDDMERAICRCASDGVWLCQPCGRSILGDDMEYKGIWKWRNQYTEVLGGLGTGIGEGDRGVICGRESECCAAREREQETDGDAEDAREAEHYQHSSGTPHSIASSSSSNSSTTTSSLSPWALGGGATSLGSLGSPSSGASSLLGRRTPSPALKPGYERHEIEGIGGVMKKKLVRMVRVGACVPEWEDERAKGDILGREMQGLRRSWCGWCRRVIPSRKDYEMDRQAEGKGKGKEMERSAS
ncbi:256ac23a-9a33-4183-9ee1-fb480e5b72b6 [Thermothielavioides terrestris]|uniref:Sulfate transporter protein n=2 Tax=Thermothielavioides terrestris TaxID=2587410 RepID=G2QSI6_THETT|nr:uncharacterized protein THITE_2108779 [Thermothielavioides terrestris NRRL 8126]AEO63468.1 hypothetical protein THITE_2108779 [Thermothielavioides terrestris NRRL 8126]SPQ21040.1 256ac23a-9a33-4183-9ee1-fb480e5b72b6 [Thermothielavioides terrestris]